MKIPTAEEAATRVACEISRMMSDVPALNLGVTTADDGRTGVIFASTADPEEGEFRKGRVGIYKMTPNILLVPGVDRAAREISEHITATVLIIEEN